jgi:hypothetical protein
VSNVASRVSTHKPNGKHPPAKATDTSAPTGGKIGRDVAAAEGQAIVTRLEGNEHSKRLRFGELAEKVETKYKDHTLGKYAKSRRVFARQELIWDGLRLRLGSKRGRILAAVERDANWPKMWRVRHGDRVSDMANLTRAKDAAILIASSELNGCSENEVE